ncbi:hypothetical protein BU24DRAFT_411156 [Aaosphaeria arxii CBS 175.79]|uniref:DUF7730 domain-containing protein n=1 Tax=Aaosphaeria arxii CBS 175.79 TaxID=1450172 RepID=A0A6A5XKT1_9PLEO|nr:uncharacterized protein BU24DRAFT_411156 [Aaosphaeria arxii CBS 175.79]KAF2013417.1 hypothetical protein BU24DRAFT_411156 [Aaosphaeria arxii CBS 175.79]
MASTPQNLTQAVVSSLLRFGDKSASQQGTEMLPPNYMINLVLEKTPRHLIKMKRNQDGLLDARIPPDDPRATMQVDHAEWNAVNSPLLKLPGELRNLILTMAVTGGKIHTSKSRKKDPLPSPSPAKRTTTNGANRPPRVYKPRINVREGMPLAPATCRQLYLEIGLRVYFGNEFTFTNVRTLFKIWNHMQHIHRRAIREIRFPWFLPKPLYFGNLSDCGSQTVIRIEVTDLDLEKVRDSFLQGVTLGPPATVHFRQELGLPSRTLGCRIELIAVKSKARLSENPTLSEVTEAIRLEEHAIRLEEHAIRMKEYAIRLEEHAIRLRAHTIQVERPAIRLEEYAIRLEEHAIRLEGHAIRWAENKF